MDMLTREQALEQWHRVKSDIERLQAQERDLRAQIFRDELRPQRAPVQRPRGLGHRNHNDEAVLKAIHDYNGPITIVDLKTLLTIAPGTIENALRRMVQRGLLHKERGVQAGTLGRASNVYRLAITSDNHAD